MEQSIVEATSIGGSFVRHLVLVFVLLGGTTTFFTGIGAFVSGASLEKKGSIVDPRPAYRNAAILLVLSMILLVISGWVLGERLLMFIGSLPAIIAARSALRWRSAKDPLGRS